MSGGQWSGALSSGARQCIRGGAALMGSRIARLSVVLGLCLAPSLAATEGTPVMRIEEDWEVVIGEPSEDEILPQLYVVTTPTGDTDGHYSVFEINNLLLPDFYGGGLQFQTWWNDQATGERHHDNYSALSTAGETITFTVRMRAWGDGNVSFRVQNGNSSTWGTFGLNSTLRIVEWCDVYNLSAYDPEKSARYSRVGFGRGRVTKFQLKQVRYYDSDNNLLSTDTTPRDAQLDEPT